MNVYTIKGYKSFIGREGHGYNLSLYRNGKKVAFVMDNAEGGEVRFEWVDYEAPAVSVTHHEIYAPYGEGIKVEERCTPEEAILWQELEGKTTHSSFSDKDYQKTPAGFVDELINKMLEEKQFKGWCKKTTVFRLKNDKDPKVWRTIASVFTPKVKALLIAKYGEHLGEIVNERFA